MKKFYAFLAIIFFPIYIQAQTPAATSPSTTQTTGQTPATNSPNTPQGATQRETSDAPPVEPSRKSPFDLPPEKKNPVRVPRFETAPAIDGKLDDPVWQQAAVFKDFWQTGPGDNVEPSKPTIAYMGYDEQNIYIAFRCFDEPDKIRATVAKRDNVFGEDNVRVWLDTYNDQRRAYILGFNPLGIQQDGIYTEGRGADFSVDIVMESKGIITADGWTLEVKIPFKSLRYAAGKGKLWGFNAARNISRFNDELDQWLPDNRNISGFLVKHGKITGLEDIKVERTLEVVPSITISEAGNRIRTIPQSVVDRSPVALIDPSRFVNERIKRDLSLNLKFNITPNVTLDAAFNPDFAEIEADAPVVSANQRFPIFFQEKRPFFLEGADIFQSPLQVFYSRQIVDPDVAAKLTGKIGKTTFGFLVASDNAPGNYSQEERNDPPIRAGINEFLDKNALFGVVRVKRDVGKENSVGFFGTARIFPEQRNFLGGVDGRFKLNPKTTMVFQVVGTYSRRCFFDPKFERALNPQQAQRNRDVCGTYFSSGTNNLYRTGNGVGYYWSLDYTEKNRGWFIEAIGRSRDYRADSGFTRRTNSNQLFFANRFSTEPKPKAALIRVDWRQFARISYDWKGRSQDGFVVNNLQFQFAHNTFIGAEFGVGYERLFEEEFGSRRSATRPNGTFFGQPERSAYQPYANLNINTTINKQLSLRGFVGWSFNNFDFDFGGGNRFPRVSPAALAGLSQLDPGPGLQFDSAVGFDYKPIDALRISADYYKSRLKRNDTDRVAFDSNIFSLRSTYQFTRFVFARTRIDYDTLSSNVSGQAILGWNPSPGKALYIGYDDNFNYNGFNPYTGQFEPRFERNSRRFFIRASYLFRKSF